ncbi:ATP-binding protein [Bradyrhizobium sp. SSBR45G]|uniref:DUF882 domain-containing protein n=1 Tax=unclassified Bradyrhizobium TaxID=2631580 RepID=UPI002342AB63|nr:MULTISPECIES: DUF882 domain-containing protein [unclassified Bradyrhizobium]GLH78779.1 ATP-binding protein [Bradyrhizobium sp. SSBR45G]GLH86507.1 ATP-binding protein [Bradyrhizobium sp. SSBR45R]
MLSVFARQSRSLPGAGWSAICRFGLASLLLLVGAGTVRDAEALNETRTLTFHHTHSGEDLTVTFKREGRYDEDALKKLNHFLRDWRTQDETVMDRRLFDILWEVYRDVDGKQPIQIISSYRSPATNSMLRRRSAHSGVARHSQHMLGHAMDFHIPGVPLEQIRYAGLRLQRGGVGFYPTSGSPFVHLDTGNIRHWPRMTADQLARVFPDGKTVHVPSNGVPLKGYELAKAEIEKRGPGDDASSGRSGLLARLFRGRPSEDDEEAGESEKADTNTKPVQTAALTSNALTSKTADNKPSTARGKITNALQLASADSQAVQQPTAPKSDTKPETTSAISAPSRDGAPQSVADIINARGFWGDNPSTPKQATPEQVAAITARRALSAIDQPQTASLMQAMAFAPAPAADRGNAATAPMPVRNSRPAATRPAPTASDAKGGQSQDGLITMATRMSSAKGPDSTWMRAIMLTPSASSSMSVTKLGDPDLTVMRSYFVKPQTALAMTFSADPTPGLSYDQFSGPAIIKLEIKSFTMRAAALR